MKKVIRIAIIIIIAISIVWLLTTIVNGIKTPSKNNTTTETKPLVLTDYANRDSKVILIIDGMVNGDDEHRSVRITVSRGTRVAEIIQGYQGNVIKSQSQENNPNAYDEFIRALAKTNYGKERKTNLPDVRGVCPDGKRYIFEVVDNNDLVSRTWSASCNKGTSLANSNQVISLFKAQVTNYSQFSGNVNL